MSSRIEVILVHDNIPAWRTQIDIADQYARRMTEEELHAVGDAVQQVIMTIAARTPLAEKEPPAATAPRYNSPKKKH